LFVFSSFMVQQQKIWILSQPLQVQQGGAFHTGPAKLMSVFCSFIENKTVISSSTMHV
jgi:hypothetical protein